MVTINMTLYKRSWAYKNWFDVVSNALRSYTFFASHYKSGDEVTTYIGNSQPLVTTELFKPIIPKPEKPIEESEAKLTEAPSNAIDATHIFKGKKKDD